MFLKLYDLSFHLPKLVIDLCDQKYVNKEFLELKEVVRLFWVSILMN
jgi:hypothetical protein